MNPYLELAQLEDRRTINEEPLISLITPVGSPRVSHERGRDERPRDGQLHPDHASQPDHARPRSRSQRSSRRRSDYEIALEQAREESLLDVDDLGSQIRSLPRGRNEMANTLVQLGAPIVPYRQPRGACDTEDATGRAAKLCVVCERFGDGRSFCNVCAITLCNSCWNTVITHRLGTRGPDDVPHEKTNYYIAEKIQAVLEPRITDQERRELHRKDENTTWFGVSRNEMDDLMFQDCGRYAALMASCSSRRKDRQHPGLVSFVGQTGAGKSTLIKMLIELRSQAMHEAVPVAGSVDHDVPTSGDVHLYLDPQSCSTDYPILYADCEGLEGGEIEPMALQAKRADSSSSRFGQPGRRTGSFQRRLRRKHHSSQREITWATTAEKRTRQYAVANLYPRLLYTFSDVVVFVLKNPRVIENVVEQLIMWASAALEKSTNQPVLPHLIIVLNATDNAIKADQWDANIATMKLLQSITEALYSKPSFRHYVQYWAKRNKLILTAHDLLCSYYSSVRVVRVPTKGRPQLINEQMAKLYDELSGGCNMSRDGKRKNRMLLDADELQPYLQYAFDHFSTNLEMPFDFVKASFLNNVIPRDFGGNILKLAIKIMNAWENKLDAAGIFRELSPLVASCIMLDSARHKTKGTAESIFRENYINHCDDALEDFCARHWPCEFSSTAGRCVNVRSGHSPKGHQLKSGRTFGSGPYMSSFSAADFSNYWKSKIHHDLDLLLGRLREASSEGESEDQTAWHIHRTAILDPFYKHVGSSEKYVSHSTCLSCLRAPPEHALPCSHVLCTPCLQAFGSPRGKFLFEIRNCPLWHERPEVWNMPWRIPFKPASAGVRILSLDGGGVRGIVELETLRHLEKILGGRIPIRDFFDLIVGTSTGGIIALGLGVSAWGIDQCINQFMSLCEQAFTHRKGYSIWGIGHLIQAHYGSIYETQPLHQALESAFPGGSLFGGRRYDDRPQTRVAVTAASAAGLQPVVFSNYNRLNTNEEKRSYVFQRPEEPEHELKTWEAARATSAAPSYFKQFPHAPSGQVYIDGGIRHNNPVVIADSERKLIWPDVAGLPPDILLSVGSGWCSTLRSPPRPLRSARRMGIGPNFRALYRIAVDHIESSLDSERAWRDYLGLISPQPDPHCPYRRLNVDLEEPPPNFDDIESLEDLQDLAKRYWARDERIASTARCLIASCFYFEKSKLETLEDESMSCTGSLQCRFTPGSQNLRDLGAYLQDHPVNGHNPYFVIQQTDKPDFPRVIPLGQDVVDNMRLFGQFTMPLVSITLQPLDKTDILLCLDHREATQRISGFPRFLQREESPRVIRRLDGNSHRARTESQLYRLGQWTGPQSYDPAEDDDTISHYSSSDYVVGDLTQAALGEIMVNFQQPTAELSGTETAIYEMPDDNGILELP